MDEDFTPAPHRRRLPTPGSSSGPSRIPGLATRPAVPGGLPLLGPLPPPREIAPTSLPRGHALAGGRGGARPGPMEPGPISTTAGPLPRADGAALTKRSSLSVTLRHSGWAAPRDRQRLPAPREPLALCEVAAPWPQPFPASAPSPRRPPLGGRERPAGAEGLSSPPPARGEMPVAVLRPHPDTQRGSAPVTPILPRPRHDGPGSTEMAAKMLGPGLQASAGGGSTGSTGGSPRPGPAWPARPVEGKNEAAMSELVPEPRQKPAVPMKPMGINANLLGYIGIDTIIEQMRKKTMKTGFDFNIMVVGQSGLGKSTLVNTLFKSQVSRKSSGWNREEKIPKTVEIKAIGHVIEEGGVKMKLTVIDTPGFGDQINNENCWEPIEKYINEQYEKFLKEEVNIARKKRIPDTRVHCCLYFISPTGHSLRPLDLEFMKHLSKVVNIIPVIAKADTMTLEEKTEFKQRVRKELEVNGIEFYPQKEFDEDLEDKTENDKIRQESMPFAVVGSDKEYQVNGKRVLGRKTPWGIIEVENLTHCEFALLRDFVIRTHLQDLKEVTHNIHYETYRAKRLNDNGGLPPMTVETEENHESNL